MRTQDGVHAKPLVGDAVDAKARDLVNNAGDALDGKSRNSVIVPTRQQFHFS